jgi:hypothetical protein
MPETVEALWEVRRAMDMGRALHRRLWAAILTAFLFMLRRRDNQCFFLGFLPLSVLALLSYGRRAVISEV